MNKSWKKIELSRPLLQLAGLLSIERNKKENKFGAMTYGNIWKGEEAHYLGLCAEIAVAHYFNEDVDTNTYEAGDGTKGDLIIKGHKIEVKATTYVNAPLLRVEQEHYDPTAIYFCCALDLPIVFLCGFATAEQVLRGTFKRFVIDGPLNYVLKDHQLQRFK